MVKSWRHIAYSKQNANTQWATEPFSAALFALKQAFFCSHHFSLYWQYIIKSKLQPIISAQAYLKTICYTHCCNWSKPPLLAQIQCTEVEYEYTLLSCFYSIIPVVCCSKTTPFIKLLLIVGVLECKSVSIQAILTYFSLCLQKSSLKPWRLYFFVLDTDIRGRGVWQQWRESCLCWIPGVSWRENWVAQL